MRTTFLIITLCFGVLYSLFGQERNTDTPIVKHTLNEQSSVVNGSHVNNDLLTPKYTLSDIRNPDFKMPLVQHTINEVTDKANTNKALVVLPLNSIVVLTVENRDEIIKQAKLVEHTKVQEGEVTSVKKN